MTELERDPGLARPPLLLVDALDAANECAHGHLPVVHGCDECGFPAPAIPDAAPDLAADEPVDVAPDLIETFRRAERERVTPVPPKRRRRAPMRDKPRPGGPRPSSEFVAQLVDQIDEELRRLEQARAAILSVVADPAHSE